MPTGRGSLTFDERLKEIDMFFEGTDRVHETMRRLASALEAEGIPYAIVGGMAVNAHGHSRTTNDVDLLMTPEGFQRFHDRFVGNEFELTEGRRWRFKDRLNGTLLDVLVTGRFPGSGRPGPVAYPDPVAVSEVIDGKRVIDLPTLVQLKLAARRHQNFADVVSLIRVHGLDEEFRARLHPSLHVDYVECLEEKRREDDYLAREG
jgi:hypothetical protein